ncbi:nuclear transport factor 2 family protein [Filimonas effusa]|uniref:Nuclear transport factor 2 family protein n=1 Tax=Filimonas effusa TaxID=2508721 RepID=A0A4Q1DAT2_9BACT|nr:hypothetical protein [Filimonas effusa]RXK85875.1 hypothetical protein ESB13_03430 [Filimonas effusa]
MRTILCISFLLLAITTIKAQEETDSVKVIVNNLFKAMLLSDSVAFHGCFAPEAIMQTVEKDKLNKTTVRSEFVAEVAGILKKFPAGTAEEKMTFDLIRIDGDLALVWAPYQFYFGGKLLHCGVNCIQLVRLAEGWRIQYIIDTRRLEGC